MDWSRYTAQIRREWDQLLDEHADSERHFHEFFERHPCMLPCLGGHHGPRYFAVISEPRLPGVKTKVPDFMWLTEDSLTAYAVLIEIEAPSKRWFTRRGRPTAEFTQALDQLRQWKAWFDNPVNEQGFRQLYSVPESFFAGGNLKPLFVLIYGRREEATQTADFAKKRAHFRRPDEHLMTYDRLRPDYDLREYISIRQRGDTFSAVEVPPTMRLGHFSVSQWLDVQQLEGAIQRNRYMTERRKQHLITRLPAWREKVQERRFKPAGEWD